MADLTLFHNTACGMSRHALQEIEGAAIEVDVVEYLKTPPDRAALIALMGKLDDPPADLVRHDDYFRELDLDPDDYVRPDAVADLLVEHPRLMQRPILVRGERAIIGRPKERADAFLAE